MARKDYEEETQVEVAETPEDAQPTEEATEVAPEEAPFEATKPCPDCAGTGLASSDALCPTCEGHGIVVQD